MFPSRPLPRPAMARVLALILLTAPLLNGCVSATIRQLRADKEMLQARVMQVSQDLGAQQEATARERQRAEDAERSRQEIARERDSLSARIADLDRRRSAAELALQSSSDSQSREMLRRIEEAMNNERTQLLEVERLQARIGTLEMQITQLETDKVALERRVLVATTQTAEDTTLLAELREAFERQSTELSTISRERQELRAQVDGLTAELNLASQKASTAEQLTADLEKRLAEMTTQQAELQTTVTRLGGEVAAAEKRATEAAGATPQPVPTNEALRDRLTRGLRPFITAGNARVVPGEGHLRVVLFSDQLFRSGTTQLSDDGLRMLGALTEALSGQTYASLLIEGHTDNIPVRNMPYPDNWELASARANEVLRWLGGRPGIETAKLSSASYSFHRPLENNRTPEGRRANRRVEIRINL